MSTGTEPPREPPRDLVSWLRSQLDADERIAIAASSDHDGSTPGGEHWRWECTNCDTPIPITPVILLDEFLECPSCQGFRVALRSVEEYPTSSVGALSHFAVSGTEEQRPVDALHIETHDPAHVLRTVAAHRAILERHEPYDVTARDDEGRIMVLATCCSYCVGDVTTADNEMWPCPDVRDIVSIYENRQRAYRPRPDRARPGFDPSWRAE